MSRSFHFPTRRPDASARPTSSSTWTAAGTRCIRSMRRSNEPQAGRARSAWTRRRPRLPQRVELFPDLRLDAVRGRRVELGADECIGQTLLVQRDAAFHIGIVLVALAVAESLHQLGR